VSGATYKDAEDDNHRVIITNWTSLDAWKKWSKSSDRANAIAAIKPILKDQEKFTVLTA
jgi:heme-degrading monooxygenase HmoA